MIHNIIWNYFYGVWWFLQLQSLYLVSNYSLDRRIGGNTTNKTKKLPWIDFKSKFKWCQVKNIIISMLWICNFPLPVTKMYDSWYFFSMKLWEYVYPQVLMGHPVKRALASLPTWKSYREYLLAKLAPEMFKCCFQRLWQKCIYEKI